MARPPFLLFNVVDAFLNGSSTSCDKVFLVAADKVRLMRYACDDYSRDVVVTNISAALADVESSDPEHLVEVALESLRPKL